MAVQFAGSSSTGDRRRRRLVVNGDGSGIESATLDGDQGEMESELVASAAAAPWIPVSELRIWIYSGILGLTVGLLCLLVAKSNDLPERLAPLSQHLVAGQTPLLLKSTEVALLALSSQLALLIGWYRSRCKLDFSGRYRVWPWVVGFIWTGMALLATEAHTPIGQIVQSFGWFPWRGATVGWLLPLCVAALPIALLLDRDLRNSRSSLWTFRTTGLCWIALAWMAVYSEELHTNSWYPTAMQLLPLAGSVTLFVCLWHHARVVAYVCPDPPEVESRGAISQLKVALIGLAGIALFWRKSSSESEEEEEKPKRRRKKVEPEEATAKRKRKAPAKRPSTRTRTRTKVADEEAAEELDESAVSEDASAAESEVEEPVEETTSWEEQQEQWEEEATAPVPPTPAKSSKKSEKLTYIDEAEESSVPAPHHQRRQSNSWEDETQAEESSQRDDQYEQDSSDDEDSYGESSKSNADQMKGLSKRQKRDLKRQLRDQERKGGR